MTNNDPCDELSGELESLLLFAARIQRMTPAHRRMAVNMVYGSLAPVRNSEANAQYIRLVKPTISRILGDTLRDLHPPVMDHRGNPVIVAEPRSFRVKYDNPISPRTWTLDK